MKKDKKIALCIKGTYYSKNWPIEKFLELINKLNSEFCLDFCIVGAKEDFEYAEDLISKTKIEEVFDSDSIGQMQEYIDMAEQLAGIMVTAEHINGNPRLIKRFLNNLIIKTTDFRFKQNAFDKVPIIFAPPIINFLPNLNEQCHSHHH